MNNTSFKFRILIPIITVLIILVVIINVFLTLRLSNIGDSLINEKLLAVTNGLKFYLDESAGKTNVAALTMAHNPDVVKAVREGDTEELIRIFVPECELYRIDYFTITDQEGKVLARTYDPDSSGDSVLNQQNVADALAGKVSTYFESGTLVMVSARTGVPVIDTDGTVIGVVSAGVRFDLDSKVEELKTLFDSEVTVFFGDTRIATTIIRDGRSIAGTTLDPRIAEIVIADKQEYSGDLEVFGEKYKIFCKPLLNAQNEAFASIFLAIPLAQFHTETNNSIRGGIILGFIGLAISILLLYFMVSSISQPITDLSNEMRNIANGNLGVDINITSNDEVGDLGKSLQKVADTLHKLLTDINETIDQHEQGNIDYFLNTEDFLGDYKTLANNIIELASISMTDQLTGLANRRTFDNRLEMEWDRAKRDKRPLSILVLDVDKFKNYNDTLGHQQGDVALKTVAKTIARSLKRPADFCARWGGEEFFVLLPSTDTKGAVGVAEYIRTEIETATVPCDDEQGRKVTVSIGVSTQIPEPDSDMSAFIPLADAALYQAKEKGRNRVVANEGGVLN